jgi:hypothetical protein
MPRRAIAVAVIVDTPSAPGPVKVLRSPAGLRRPSSAVVRKLGLGKRMSLACWTMSRRSLNQLTEIINDVILRYPGMGIAWTW